jgi:hypothetical protein
MNMRAAPGDICSQVIIAGGHYYFLEMNLKRVIHSRLFEKTGRISIRNSILLPA